MKLPLRPKTSDRGARSGGGSRAPAAVPVARRGSGARARRRNPFRLPRLRLGVPALARALALVLAAATVGLAVVVVNGPWLRVSSIAWAGTRYTDDAAVHAILDPLRGRSLVTLDDRAVRAAIAALPSVASAEVDAQLPDRLAVRIIERSPAVVWQTTAVRLLLAANGTVIGEVALSASLPAALSGLPFVDDRRAGSHDIVLGASVPDADRSIALDLAALSPVLLGSGAASLQVGIDDRCGYTISPTRGASWTAALGVYGPLTGDASAASTRISEQAAAIRTLFAAHRENTVGWVDVRNPGKVYWRPNGPGSDGADAC